jgi:hypothetical protein
MNWGFVDGLEIDTKPPNSASEMTPLAPTKDQ